MEHTRGHGIDCVFGELVAFFASSSFSGKGGGLVPRGWVLVGSRLLVLVLGWRFFLFFLSVAQSRDFEVVALLLFVLTVSFSCVGWFCWVWRISI
ncbi:hypothetical protein B0T19DRAFT_411261 [Cercophora scortea]|uniref:Transmembrane protein n=1 Tax=Cercophora scortea TaxID=314031 RepID=A0AAE0J517_9PEZI|nr:hypothetical protein B0T19DRAFT_411261 [Cercophora scortea]